MASTVLWGVGAFLQGALICRPIEYTWNKAIKGSCGNLHMAVNAVGAFSTLLELIMFIMPMPLIFKMNLAAGKKIALGCIFGLGFLSVAHPPELT